LSAPKLFAAGGNRFRERRKKGERVVVRQTKEAAQGGSPSRQSRLHSNDGRHTEKKGSTGEEGKKVPNAWGKKKVTLPKEIGAIPLHHTELGAKGGAGKQVIVW